MAMCRGGCCPVVEVVDPDSISPIIVVQDDFENVIQILPAQLPKLIQDLNNALQRISPKSASHAVKEF